MFQMCMWIHVCGFTLYVNDLCFVKIFSITHLLSTFKPYAERAARETQTSSHAHSNRLRGGLPASTAARKAMWPQSGLPGSQTTTALPADTDTYMTTYMHLHT